MNEEMRTPGVLVLVLLELGQDGAAAASNSTAHPFQRLCKHSDKA
ncbi:MAG: hypothetical protein OXC05_03950 [Halieaceae bacterium]|nr:hypothetical protein [Halieaceae bacterium]